MKDSRELRDLYKMWTGKHVKREKMEDLGVHLRIILKWILEKWVTYCNGSG
jgi:hypothetical protein